MCKILRELSQMYDYPALRRETLIPVLARRIQEKVF
jgi:hypothetical protein